MSHWQQRILLQKLLIISCLILLTLFVFGCASDPNVNVEEPINAEINSTVVWQDGAAYAVAFLGYGSDNMESSLLAYLKKYLPNLSRESITEILVGGDESYLIIPRYTATKMVVFGCDLEAETAQLIKGEKLQDVTAGMPFVITCNVSDLYPNCLIDCLTAEQTITFSPRISLKDGTICCSEFGQDITEDKVQ